MEPDPPHGSDRACWLCHPGPVPNVSEPHRATGKMRQITYAKRECNIVLGKGGVCEENEGPTGPWKADFYLKAFGIALVSVSMLGQQCVTAGNAAGGPPGLCWPRPLLSVSGSWSMYLDSAVCAPSSCSPCLPTAAQQGAPRLGRVEGSMGETAQSLLIPAYGLPHASRPQSLSIGHVLCQCSMGHPQLSSNDNHCR